MGSRQSTLSPGRANLALATLFLGMFVLGSAELLVVGVLNVIATDLRVSIPTAGALVTAYALGLAIGGPLLTALTIKLNKRTVLIGALVLFIVGNLALVVTASYGLFLVARTVTGAIQGLFIATAFATGTSLVPPERIGRAISVIISGVTVSAAVGVPLGTLAGPGGALAGSLPASAVNVGIAFGAFAGGVAIKTYSVSSIVLTGLIIGVIAIPVAWATSFLRPPVVPSAEAPTPEPLAAGSAA